MSLAKRILEGLHDTYDVSGDLSKALIYFKEKSDSGVIIKCHLIAESVEDHDDYDDESGTYTRNPDWRSGGFLAYTEDDNISDEVTALQHVIHKNCDIYTPEEEQVAALKDAGKVDTGENFYLIILNERNIEQLLNKYDITIGISPQKMTRKLTNKFKVRAR